jgi:cell division protein FtsZ
MSDAGSALMGIGSARGDHRAAVAAEMAVSSPLLEASIEGARGVLLSIAGGSDLGLFEINEAAGLVADAVHEDANIIFGAVIDDALGDEVRVTVIAAGFDGGEPKVRDVSQPALLKETPADPPTAESFLSHDPVLDGQQPVTVQADPPPTEYGDDLDIPDFLR